MGRFLIVDDHTAVREGLRRVLETEFPGATIGFAATPQEAFKAVDREFWHLAIVDISLPGGDGLGVIRDLKDRSPRTRVLTHTMHPEDQFGVRALRAGADGFVTKDAPVAQIIRAVQKLLEGGRYVSPGLAELLAGAVASRTPIQALESLSDRELQILTMITAGKTPTEIAREMNLSIKTISTYRTRMLEKLSLRTTAELIRFGIEHQLSVG